MEENLTPFQRFMLAFVAFFACLFNPTFANAVHRLREAQKAGLPLDAGGGAKLVQAEVRRPQDTRKQPQADALQLLSVLQRDGRLIDFLQEDLSSYPDADIGAAARSVHTGCRKVLESYFKIAHVYSQPEGSELTLDTGFDAARVRLTGNVVGNPPFRGALRHAGWKAVEVNLPARPDGQDPSILAPAEVELP